MRYTANKLRNRIDISNQRVIEVMNKYTVLYCQAMRDLYDMGYSSSPYFIDEDVIRSAILDEFEDVKYLVNHDTGGISFRGKIVDYACYKSDDEDFKDSILKFREYLELHDKLNVCNEFLSKAKKRGQKTSLNLNIIVSERIQYRTKLDLLPEFLYEESDYDIESINCGDCFLHSLALEVGLSEDEYKEHKESGEAFFISGLSQEEEENLIDLIYNASVKLDTDLGIKWTKMLIAYRNEFDNKKILKSVQRPYSSIVFTNAMPLVSDKVNAFRKVMYAKGGEELYIQDYSVLFKVPKADNKSFNLPNTLKVGDYMYREDGSEIFSTDIFNGIQGVFSSSGSVGACIHSYTKKKDVYERVCFSSLKTKYNKLTDERVFEIFEVDSWDKIIDELLDVVSSRLSAELIYAVLRARCEYYEYRLSDEALRGITKDTYISACKEAICTLQYISNIK